MQALSGLVSILALIISLIAVYFTARTYWQKRGASVRGSYTLTSGSIYTDHKFVNEVIIENLKDRSIVIFGIYLRLSHGYTLEIELFDESPFILKPFEVMRRAYDPVDFYSFNNSRINFNNIFDNNYRNNYLVLSTSDGKLKVRKTIPTWDPLHDWFKNHLRITAQSIRTNFDGVSYGGNVLFLVDLFKGNQRISRIPLYPREFRFKWFSDLGATEDTMKSTLSIRKLFEDAILSNKIQADYIEVIDAKKTQELSHEHVRKELIVAEKSSWAHVNVIGRIMTWKHSRAIRRQNQKIQKDALQASTRTIE